MTTNNNQPTQINTNNKINKLEQNIHGITNRATLNLLNDHLILAINAIYKPANVELTGPIVSEPESSEYGACRLRLNNQSIAFRVAKTTPTKIGQFVTIWKRPTPTSEIVPLDINDSIEFVVISVHDETHRGQFVFDQRTLIEKGIMSKDGKGGKLAFRIYPSWTKPIVKQAIRTQQWQLKYFFPISENGTADCMQVRKLFKVGSQENHYQNCETLRLDLF